jgi:hypothetical protein
MTAGLILGALLFLACAIAGQKHALYIPSIVLLVAGAANAIAGPLY